MNEDVESLSATMAGRTFRAKGKELFPWALILLLFCALAWMVRFSLSMWGAPVDIAGQFGLHRGETEREHARVGGEVDALNYTIAICMNPNRRDECYRLSDRAMPDTLREKLRR